MNLNLETLLHQLPDGIVEEIAASVPGLDENARHRILERFIKYSNSPVKTLSNLPDANWTAPVAASTPERILLYTQALESPNKVQPFQHSLFRNIAAALLILLFGFFTAQHLLTPQMRTIQQTSVSEQPTSNTEDEPSSNSTALVLSSTERQLIAQTPKSTSDLNRGGEVLLKRSSPNVKVRHIRSVSLITNESDLVYYTPEEIFAMPDLSVFKGEVLSIENLEISFDGFIQYRARAEIEVEKVFKGTCMENKCLSVFLPCSINFDQKEFIGGFDNEVITLLRPGTRGIFMPRQYEKDSYWEIKGYGRLYMTELADYGFADGLRWAFLETPEGPIFGRACYPEIAEANHMDEVEAYVRRMCQQPGRQSTSQSEQRQTQ